MKLIVHEFNIIELNKNDFITQSNLHDLNMK